MGCPRRLGFCNFSSIRLSFPASDAPESPTEDQADGENKEKDYGPGGGNGPCKEGDAYIVNILENKNERQNAEHDSKSKSKHTYPSNILFLWYLYALRHRKVKSEVGYLDQVDDMMEAVDDAT
jgi:hypothetical protein